MAPCLKGCSIVAIGQYKLDWTPAMMKKWVEYAGGHVSFKPKITEETTHVLLTEKEWQAQSPFVQEVIEAKNGGQEIHIVSFEWLEACLDKRAKRSETRCSWENMDKKSMKANDNEAKRLSKMDKDPRTTQGLMAQTFLATTEAYITDHDRKKIAQQQEKDEQARQEAEEEKRQQFKTHRQRMSVPEQAAIFQKSAKRARVEILSDNHHIYVDRTGFTFDVTITKVDWKQNKNERYVLTIYESNNEPHTYAFHCKFAATKTLPENHIIVAIGSNFLTAFRAFKKLFFEKTRVQWDKRLSQHIGSGIRGGRQGAGDQATSRPIEVRFEDAPFVYHPPVYGPKGEVPGETIVLDDDDDIPVPEEVASDGNRVASRSPSKAPSPKKPSSGAGDSGVDGELDPTAMDEPADDPFAYPFENNATSFDFDQTQNLSGGDLTMDGELDDIVTYQSDFFGIDSQQPASTTDPGELPGSDNGGLLGKRKLEVELD